MRALPRDKYNFWVGNKPKEYEETVVHVLHALINIQKIATKFLKGGGMKWAYLLKIQMLMKKCAAQSGCFSSILWCLLVSMCTVSSGNSLFSLSSMAHNFYMTDEWHCSNHAKTNLWLVYLTKPVLMKYTMFCIPEIWALTIHNHHFEFRTVNIIFKHINIWILILL